MDLYGTIVEGIGNELLFVLSFMGTVLFLIGAWISTRVNWELMPIRITLFHHPHEVHDSRAEATSIPESVEPDTANSTGNVFSDSSSSCSEDETNPDTHVSKRASVQTSDSPAYQRKSSSNESKVNKIEEQQPDSASGSNEHFTIKLQYLNDESRFVHAAPTMSVNRFKKKHFMNELINQKKNVRLIFQGRELLDVVKNEIDCQYSSRPKRQRLCDYGVTDGSTIHCLVTTPVLSSTSSSTNDPGNTGRNFHFSSSSDSMLTEFDMGTRLMKPLFAFLLIFTWFFRIVYRQYFNSVSTFALVTLTVFFCGSVLTTSIMNAMSAVASIFGISISNSSDLPNRQSDYGENSGNQSGSDGVQVVTVTMVARRVPSDASANQINNVALITEESSHNQQIIVDDPINELQRRSD
uniref:Transmembrane and ubiquitin-like domain-containing protein 2 n=1 Tax=Schistosoma japonicum TaxID=6182 RepID=C1LK55_SCHJA|nr:Transmembrane and ubiquitin-like domain-containing protein 2 [Schistosoma japonicum]CAX75085.1 Transmembrane and ubiquitin-like domain-containing protein 2 [Schistosoma japonicum]